VRHPQRVTPKKDPAPPPPEIQMVYQGSRVYIEPEVDRPVVRDPLSDGPAYPEALRSKQIEGSVMVRFIVDTLGFADSSSFRVIEATHPGFADAVRSALPRMRFLPAETAGRHVPQLVMQLFRFVLDHPDTGLTRQVGRSE
jgi:protein TonB